MLFISIMLFNRVLSWMLGSIADAQYFIVCWLLRSILGGCSDYYGYQQIYAFIMT